MAEDAPDIPPVRPRRTLNALLDGGLVGDWRATLLDRALIALVIVSVACIVLETVPDLRESYGTEFRLTELVAIVVFSIEYALRLWCAPEQPRYAGLSGGTARVRYARSLPALIDLASILPAYLGWFTGGGIKILLLFRLARFFKLARYSPGMRSLAAVLQAERKALLASAVVLLGIVILAAAAMYAAEAEAQPDKLGSIPAAMWWAVVTLSTVGYGDVYPVTAGGRMVASLTMVFGLITFALPVGIVATAFAEEIHRRDFVVTWGMVARVPLFIGLDASEIGEITKLLHARTVTAGAAVVRQGEVADAMYLITSGEVEVELPGGGVLLREGDFFGEMALVQQRPRSATVRARQATKLLVLDAVSLNGLMARNTDIRDSIHAAAREREQANQ